jgi:hypothetical protein
MVLLQTASNAYTDQPFQLDDCDFESQYPGLWSRLRIAVIRGSSQ